MKNLLWFIIGILFGVLIMILNGGESIDFLSKKGEEAAPIVRVEDMGITAIPGMTLFENVADVLKADFFKVESILENGYAMVVSRTKNGFFYVGNSVKMLLIPSSGERFFNDQEIEIGKGRQAVRVGEYRYSKYTYTDDTYEIAPVVVIIER